MRDPNDSLARLVLRSAEIFEGENDIELVRHADGMLRALSIDYGAASQDGYSIRCAKLFQTMLPDPLPGQQVWMYGAGPADDMVMPIVGALTKVSDWYIFPELRRTEGKYSHDTNYSDFAIRLDGYPDLPREIVEPCATANDYIFAKCWGGMPSEHTLMSPLKSVREMRPSDLERENALWMCYTCSGGLDVGLIAVDDGVVEDAFSRAAAL